MTKSEIKEVISAIDLQKLDLPSYTEEAAKKFNDIAEIYTMMMFFIAQYFTTAGNCDDEKLKEAFRNTLIEICADKEVYTYDKFVMNIRERLNDSIAAAEVSTNKKATYQAWSVCADIEKKEIKNRTKLMIDFITARIACEADDIVAMMTEKEGFEKNVMLMSDILAGKKTENSDDAEMLADTVEEAESSESDGIDTTTEESTTEKYSNQDTLPINSDDQNSTLQKKSSWFAKLFGKKK